MLAALTTKLKNLKKEYVSIVNEQVKTGNDSLAINYPDYWDTLVLYYGDMKGAGSVEYGVRDDEFLPGHLQASSLYGIIISFY